MSNIISCRSLAAILTGVIQSAAIPSSVIPLATIPEGAILLAAIQSSAIPLAGIRTLRGKRETSNANKYREIQENYWGNFYCVSK